MGDNKDGFFISNSSRNTSVGKGKQMTSRNSKSAKDNTPNDSKTQKKPFDKKLWRQKKYSNKYKFKVWEEKRKNTMLHQYKKEIKKEGNIGFNVKEIYENYNYTVDEDIHSTEQEISDNVQNIIDDKHEKTTTKDFKMDKNQRKIEYENKKLEREKMLKIKKQKKSEEYRKLSKKTRKGQPIMKYHMEVLLEKIQNSIQG